MSATTIHRTLQANASMGWWPKCSLNFLCHRAVFIAFAWSHASNLTFIASYMMMTVKAAASAKKSDPTPYLMAIDEVSDITTAECTDGIHPLHNALFITKLHVFTHSLIPFKKTAAKKATIGIKIICA